MAGRMSMRDMARRDRMRDMARSRRDMARRRNSTGRFTSDRARDYASRDYRSGSYNYDGTYNRDYYINDMAPKYSRDDVERYSRQDGLMYDYSFEPSREYAGYYGDTPFYTREMRDFRGDYASEGSMSDKELKEWYHDMLAELESGEKEMFSMDKIQHKAEEMGIKFDEFSPMALAVATLMTYTDYADVLGKGSPEKFIALGKAWLCDEDSELQYEDKLTAYHDHVLMPE